MKELPYLKFNAAEWITGNITLEDFYTQGVFINICALYWFKSGNVETTEIKRRLKCKQATIDLLFKNGHIKSEGDHIKISFLDEQFTERGHISKINSKNGAKGGAPKGNNNAKNEEKNNRPLDLEQPKSSNIEEEQNKNKNKNKNNTLSTTVDDGIKNEFEKSILEIIQSIKSEILQSPVKEYKITPKRIRMITNRKKEFDKLWPGRDFYKACKYAFGYKAKEWFGNSDMFRYFEPETLLSEKFISYLESAEQNNGEPYRGEPKTKSEEKLVYTIPK